MSSTQNDSSCKRVCQVIKLKPEHIEAYKSIHANAWPSVLSALQRANISDYSIHHFQLPTNNVLYNTTSPLHLLIATFKYTGSDYAHDMHMISQDPDTQRWWSITDKMQESFVDGAQGSGKGDWWLDIPEVFRFEGTPNPSNTQSSNPTSSSSTPTTES